MRYEHFLMLQSLSKHMKQFYKNDFGRVPTDQSRILQHKFNKASAKCVPTVSVTPSQNQTEDDASLQYEEIQSSNDSEEGEDESEVDLSRAESGKQST